MKGNEWQVYNNQSSTTLMIRPVTLDQDQNHVSVRNNNLDYSSVQIERQFKKKIYFDGNSLSNDVKLNCTLFFFYYFLVCIWILIGASTNLMEDFHSYLILIACYSSTCLTLGVYCLWRTLGKKKVLGLSNTLAILTVVLASLISGFQKSVVHTLTGIQSRWLLQSNSMLIVSSLTVLRLSCFECFKSMFGSSIITLMVYSSTKIGFTVDSSILELAYLTFTTVILCFNTHFANQKQKRFYKTKIQGEKLQMQFLGSNQENRLRTRIERIARKLDLIKKELKLAISQVMQKDLRKLLKTIFLNLQNMKLLILHQGLEFSDSFDMEEQLDVYQTRTRSRKSGLRKSTVMELIANYPAPDIKSFDQDQLNQHLSNIGCNWNFDIWKIKELTGQIIPFVGLQAMQRWLIQQEFEIPTDLIQNYFTTMEQVYLNNPYHNSVHAADVLSSLLYFMSQTEFSQILTLLEYFSIIISCIGHDVGHQGLTNKFLVSTRDRMAIRYNDFSVLENMHSSLTFEIMDMENHDILGTLSQQNWSKIRPLVSGMILDTDMARHNQILGKFRTRSNNLKDLSPYVLEDLKLILSVGIKAADIGHAAKNIKLHVKWSKLITEEFFNQGDLQKSLGLPISMLCDRNSVNINVSQSNFLKFLAIPLYEAWTEYLNSPKTSLCLCQAL